MHRRRITVALLLPFLAMGTGACSASGGDAGPALTTATSSSPADPSEEPAEPTEADFASLEAKLVQDVDGFALQPDDYGDTGPSDLAKAKRDDGSEEGADALVRYGFRLGYQKLFENEAGDQVILFVYEFQTAAGATAMCQFGAERTEAEFDDRMVDAVEVAGVPTVYARSGSDDSYTSTIVDFAANRFCTRIVGIGQAGSSPESAAVSVAKEQHQLLR